MLSIIASNNVKVPLAKIGAASLTELFARFGYIGLPQETPRTRDQTLFTNVKYSL